MAIQNAEVAALFTEYANLLDIEGDDNVFRSRAYRNAARIVEDYGTRIADLVLDEKDLTEIPGIGKDLAAKIRQIVATGTFEPLEQKRESLGGLGTLLRIPGLGPKRVKELYDRLGVSTPEQLAEAAEKGKIQELPRFGAKIEAEILTSLKAVRKAAPGRLLLSQAIEIAEPLVAHLERFEGAEQVTIAGSYRRRLETIGDLDILAVCADSASLMQHFVQYEDCAKVISHGTTRSSIVLRSGIQVDLRVVPEESYGAALHYFTGSKAHNIKIRHLGQRRKLKVSEYGVFKEEKPVAGRTEADVFAQVGLPFIEPELREDNGEIEAAFENRLPELVTEDDICGDLHVHSTYTDGRATIEEMAEAAKKRGCRYIAVTDHSQRIAMAHGLDPERLRGQMHEIDKLNEQQKRFVILKGIEVDILEDGSLDLPDAVLQELDVVVCSVHSKFKLPVEKQTERIIRAMDNPYCSILGHPTGRLIGKREGYQVNLEKIIDAAAERGCFLEINSQPDRLDLAAPYIRLAKERGVMLSISTDAHSTHALDFIKFGVAQARRGWLEPGNVLNTRKPPELRKLLRR